MKYYMIQKLIDTELNQTGTFSKALLYVWTETLILLVEPNPSDKEL